ncbi:MAG: hypothetical protein R3B60_04045 [Candidatus Paceibacterota bacterium]
MNSFSHQALELKEEWPLVYTAMSKHLFYYRMFISKYVLEQSAVPLNPFMVFDYFLLDAVDRDLVRQGNNSMVGRSDEIWVFGPVSNGVLAEVQIAKEQGKPVKYFKIAKPHTIIPIDKSEVEMEDEVREFRESL